VISIKKNKELEYEIYMDFREFMVAGVDFGAAISDAHPGINVENHRAYIDDFYAKHGGEIDASVSELNDALEKTQSKFFAAIKRHFGEDYSKREYTGFLSIFDCNPRFVENGTFQVYYKRDLPDKLEVCFHEVAHFIFFDYCDMHLAEKVAKLDKNSGAYWELSEIFNVILLNLPEFRELLGREEKLFYPELQAKLDRARELFESGKTKTVADLVSRYLEES